MLLHLWLRLLPLAEFIALHWLIDKYWIQFSSFGTQISRYVTPFHVLKHVKSNFGHLFSNFKGPLQFLNIPFQVFLGHSFHVLVHMSRFVTQSFSSGTSSFKFQTPLSSFGQLFSSFCTLFNYQTQFSSFLFWAHFSGCTQNIIPCPKLSYTVL